MCCWIKESVLSQVWLTVDSFFLKRLKGSFISLDFFWLITPHMFVLFLEGKIY